MMDWGLYVQGLAAALCLALVGWLMSLYRRNVTVVDSLWSIMFLLMGVVYLLGQTEIGQRAVLTTALLACWALRLASYLTKRNWGQPEDRRYQQIRRNNEPYFGLKSLYLVFGLQALLAWLISMPLLAAMGDAGELGPLDYAGLALWVLGFAFETIGDWQLSRFKAVPSNRDRVMERGLWRYTRHPNYFGECCVWWGFYLIALAAGGWWSLLSPLLMTFLLLKVSGVTMLEKDIGDRRPAYRDYIARTNAFIPGLRR